ncbi:MAG: RagB/SusD family nutrient uptake outer membrane protein [Prevotellaceae bacterium]|jgi:hypothetical protein|nr:RagB/SusD family nutrient uptake outer membrane protein [Prevotellaceae bacterium]
MKRIIKIMFLTALLLYTPSCADYLDIVPDSNITLDDYFERKEMALSALAKVYSYLPMDNYVGQSSYLLGDEWVGRIDSRSSIDDQAAFRIMRGLQTSNNPLLAYWTSLYQAIRSANIFIANVDNVLDMTDDERKNYKAQAKFLKAYYHFRLLQQYGPIAIMDNLVALDATSEDLFHKRSKVEDCFNYIINLMNEAIPDLKERASLNDLGQVDKVAAMGIKARVLLFRASPFLNGNKEYYGDFFDFDGQPFFPLEYNREKWKDAADAADTAIQMCLANGIDLYEWEKVPFLYDRQDYEANENLRTLYNLRMVVVDPWNRELVWGLTSPFTFGYGMLIPDVSNIRLPKNIADENNTYAGQWLGASYKMLERYYTKNGLPIDDDRSFDRNAMYRITQTPGENDTINYPVLRGIMQPGVQTINMYLNRELRFYANLGITGGWWRGHTRRINLEMYSGGNGGYDGGTSVTNYLYTGVGVQKFVHPESKAGNWSHLIEMPYPIMRMADLYLIKAEALNEYLDAPNDEVWDAVNKVRRRAGIPTVQESWTSPNARRPNRHRDKAGMKEIILQERGIELAFEGSRFWDMHRHKKAVAEFSSPISGWAVDKFALKDFFVLKTLQARKFTAKDYLWPISLNETNKNANLKQNPGW